MKKISIVTPCFNEEENITELLDRIRKSTAQIENIEFEHIFIDNGSTDNTVEIIKKIAKENNQIKLIINQRNFGHIRSPMHALLQATGDAVILMVSDLQDPPELIPNLIEKWEQGYKVAVCTKPTSKENSGFFILRKLYYRFIKKISDAPLIENFTGFGIFDKEFINQFRKLNDPYPYFRGLISEFGFKAAEIPFEQPRRVRGITKNNLYTLYDMAMLGITSHSKLPLRLATMSGFVLSFISLLIAIGYGVAKLLFWDSFSLGMAPLVVGLFFFGSVQLFFIGLLGEYIGAIHTQVMKRPLVIEKERINFDVGNVNGHDAL
ncbi:MAG TPA: glycosyltransferase family 2 protein [Azonexus sp.]|nr:glycosyltransferase family 2 protein [Azonexus sp.]